MKPLGMTADFRVIRPSRAEDAIWSAVEEAIAAGMSPQDFRSEAARAREHQLKQAAEHADKALRKL